MKYDDKIKNKVFKRYKMGESVQEIAKDGDTPTDTTIYKWINNSNIKKQKTKRVVDYRKEIVKLYNQNYNTIQIGEKIGFHPSTIGRFLNKLNLKPKCKNIRVTPKQIETIVDLYINQYKTTEQIAELFYPLIKSGNTIANILRDNNVKIRDAKRRIIIKNEDFFEIIDNEFKAYILGLIITDGGIINNKDRDSSNRQNDISICLKNKDQYLLKKIKNIIGVQSRKIYTARNEAYLRFTSDKMISDLNKYGIVQNKTFKTYLPTNIQKPFMRHLIRGIFDGDGTVYINHQDDYRFITFGFYGTKLLLTQIKDYLINIINISNNSVFSKKSVSMIYFSKKRDVENFYHYIYDNSNLYLKRKKEVFSFMNNS